MSVPVYSCGVFSCEHIPVCRRAIVSQPNADRQSDNYDIKQVLVFVRVVLVQSLEDKRTLWLENVNLMLPITDTFHLRAVSFTGIARTISFAGK
jgi:hypothetical protein